MTSLAAVARAQVGPYLRWWDGADRGERALGAVVGLAVAALAGAFVFGVWHVVGGWMIKGNPRAGAFGVGLSAATGIVLAVAHATIGPRFRR